MGSPETNKGGIPLKRCFNWINCIATLAQICCLIDIILSIFQLAVTIYITTIQPIDTKMLIVICWSAIVILYCITADVLAMIGISKGKQVFLIPVLVYRWISTIYNLVAGTCAIAIVSSMGSGDVIFAIFTFILNVSIQGGLLYMFQILYNFYKQSSELSKEQLFIFH